MHGTGTVFAEEGTNASCAGCHSGNAFAERIKAGLNPDQLTHGDTDPTPPDCRACHKIHETYTEQDFALRTTKPVALFAISGLDLRRWTGESLRQLSPAAARCAGCGQRRHQRDHHALGPPPWSPELHAAGRRRRRREPRSSPSGHYGAVENTCVTCHMGDRLDHHFEPEVATCQRCHPGATNFDIDGVQTEMLALADQLGAALVNLGLLSDNTRMATRLSPRRPKTRPSRCGTGSMSITRTEASGSTTWITRGPCSSKACGGWASLRPWPRPGRRRVVGARRAARFPDSQEPNQTVIKKEGPRTGTLFFGVAKHLRRWSGLLAL